MNLFSLLCFAAVATRPSWQLSCYCSDCDPTETVGEFYQNECHYLATNATLAAGSVPVNAVLDRHALDMFHRVTMRYYKVFDKNVIRMNLSSSNYVTNRLRLPSYSLKEMVCPRYEIGSNIVFDEYDHCDTLPWYARTSNFSTRAAPLTRKQARPDTREEIWNTNVDETMIGVGQLERDIEFRYIDAVDTTDRCDMASISTRQDYIGLERYWQRRRTIGEDDIGACLVAFDPDTVKLTRDDLFVHVSSSSSSSSRGCHLADADVGKLFQVPGCDASAAGWLKSRYLKCCWFDVVIR
jgi:hypothetical protein